MHSIDLAPEEKNVRILRIINNCILAYVIPLTLILAVLPSDPLLYVNNLSMVLLVLAFELLQHKVKNFFLFSLGHMVCLYLLIFFATTWGELGIRLIYGLLAMGINYAVRLRHRPALYPYWPMMGVALFIYCAAAYMHSRPLEYIAYASEIAYTFLVLLFYNARSLEFALDRSPSQSEVPLQRIRHTNRLIIAIWSCLGAILILISTLLTFGPALLRLIGRGLGLLLQGIVLFIAWIASHIPALQPTPEEEGMSLEDYLSTLGEGESNPVLNVIFNILQYALIALLVFLALRFTWRLLHSMYGEFAADDAEEVEERVFEEPADETGSADHPEETETLSRFRRTPAAQIRRMYITLIRRSPHLRDIRTYHTPREIEEVSGAVNGTVHEAELPSDPSGSISAGNASDAARELHRLYEKARYAPETCTREDVLRFRRAMHHLSGEVRR